MIKGLIASFLLATLILGSPSLSHAQLTTAPGGGNKKASVTERIGIDRKSVV